MTKGEIQTAIAEECGWSLEKSNERDGRCWHLKGIQSDVAPPDYLEDANAQHEVFMSRSDPERINMSSWMVHLGGYLDYSQPVEKIVARVLAQFKTHFPEAFLRTTGGWKE